MLNPVHVSAYTYPCHVEKENCGDRPAKYTRLPSATLTQGQRSVSTVIAIHGVSKQPATATSSHP